MAKKKFIIGNWKMNPLSLAEAKAIASGTKRAALGAESVQTVVCPPFPFLSEVGRFSDGKRFALGAQDLFIEGKGAYTGYVSAPMLASVGARFVIVGHSERRALGETDEMVQKKLSQALASGLFVVLCVGESARTEHGEYLAFIKDQLHSALSKVERPQWKKVLIAYEPIWAIGKTDDKAMQPPQIHEMKIFIRKVLSLMLASSAGGAKEAQKIASSVPVLYGGSTSARVAEAILKDGEADGLLVGGKSLDPKEFSEMIRIADSISKRKRA